MNTTINLHEMYTSIQGESSFCGLPCFFIRLAGCSLRCHWCDSKFTWKKGQDVLLADVISETEKSSAAIVEVTGGEPLEQENCYLLLEKLLQTKKTVLLETGGHIFCDRVPENIHRIIDIKCPSSGMSLKNNYKNLEILTSKDELKFVLGDENDFFFARDLILKYNLQKKSQILFSTVFGTLNYQRLVDLILESKIQVRFQLQMHKFIWNPDQRGV